MSVVKVAQIKGGQLVTCSLCGDRDTFWASDTNHAEAFRLATAFAWHHEHGEPHEAAVEAFHAKEPPLPSKEEVLIAEIFGGSPPDELRMRKRSARAAAARAKRR